MTNKHNTFNGESHRRSP